MHRPDIVHCFFRRVLLVALLLTLAACGGTPAPPTIGAPAPDFALPTLDGGEARLAELRGQVVIVNFWASWCTPCENETPRLIDWYDQHHAAGLTVLGVNTLAQDSRAAVEAFAANYGMPYPVPLDETGDVAQQWLANQLPRSYVIDRAGVVRYMRLGELTERDFSEQIAPLLAEEG